MSRDHRAAPAPGPGTERDTVEVAAGDGPGAIDPGHDPLLTAYVDGVAELAHDERHRVEAWLTADPRARADADAVQGLLGRLRALRPNGDVGDEPDWAAMERSIHQAISAAPPPPWWRRWRWLVPAMTCATAAAVLFVIGPRSVPSTVPSHPPAAEPAARAAPPATDSVVALWLDGDEVDVDVSTPDDLGDVGRDLDGAAARPPQIEDADEIGLLPATDLAWVDGLDDADLDRVERWLANPDNATRAAKEKKI